MKTMSLSRVDSRVQLSHGDSDSQSLEESPNCNVQSSECKTWDESTGVTRWPIRVSAYHADQNLTGFIPCALTALPSSLRIRRSIRRSVIACMHDSSIIVSSNYRFLSMHKHA